MGDPRFEKAAKSLLNKGEITEEQYNGIKDLDAEKLKKISFLISPSGLSAGGRVARDVISTIGLTALAATLGHDLYSRVKQQSDIEGSMKTMINKVPALKEADVETVKDYFDVVRTFSPRSASNPLVAGALVNKMIQFGGVDHKLVQDIASMEAPRYDALSGIAEVSAKSLTALPKDIG